MPLSRALTRLQASGLAKSITRIEVTQQLHFTHTIRPAWWWRATLHLFHPWGCALDHRVRQRSSYHLLEGRHWVTECFLSLPPGRGTVYRQQSLLRQPCIHSVEPWKLIYSPHLSHHLSYIVCILSQRNMCLTTLAVFWLYVILVCSFFYITLHHIAILFFHTKRHGNIRTRTSLVGIECRWGSQKSRFWANIWLHRVLSTVRQPTGVINTVPPDCGKLWHLSLVSGGVCWWRETTTKWQEVSTLRQRQQNSTASNCTQW